MRLLLLSLLIAACSQAPQRHPSSSPRQTTWQAYLTEEVYPRGLQEVFPSVEHLQRWQPNGNILYGAAPILPHQLDVVPLDCKDKRLWPTHPQQSNKEYVHAHYANYLHAPVDSRACERTNPTGRFCIRSTYANLVIMSDTYEDACGHRYRAYWLNAYLQNEESMGTLSSRGRTFYPKRGSQIRGEVEDGQTYPQPEKDFLLLTPLLPKDAATIKDLRERALKGRYVLKDRQFVLKE